MRYFPQLSSGASAQFPMRKRRFTRTILNESLDGHRIKLADPDAVSLEWHLDFREMTDEELNTLQQFFQSMEGRLGNFCFLDPTANLLSRSEELNRSVWEKSTLLQITGEIEDPRGSSRASRIVNTSGSALQIRQTLSAPSWFEYCFSLYIRCQGSESVDLFHAADAAVIAASRNVTDNWKRILLSNRFQADGESITFGLEIQPGSSIEVFGMQVESQPAASSYKRSYAFGAVYPNARFRDDSITITTSGPNQHSCTVKILSEDRR